ncbi:vWFA domain containing protein [Halapricum desulfuricans]|uniref:VWFA domain containing protein n=1 Tax=Halapricum desulfuricans TaxID=2841257 RepID=A0A897N938_9EURY|nr:vWFA domain containing protein [Halapricum desulfuricans]
MLDDVSSSQSNAGHGPPGHNRARDPSNVSVPDIPTNNSIQSLILARDRALALADEHDKSASEFERVADLTNESIEEYRQFDRIDSRAAFVTGIRAQRALSKLAKHSDEDAIENVSKPLFEAYNRSSRIAVLDASHAVAVYESEFRNPGQRQRVERLDKTACTDTHAAAERLETRR